MSVYEGAIFLGVLLLTQLYKLIGKRYGVPTGKRAVSVVIIIVSFVLTWIFGDYVLPACSIDVPNVCVNDYIALITSLSGSAMLTYNIFIEKVFEKVGLEPPLG